jgi:predicted amidohydrolase
MSSKIKAAAIQMDSVLYNKAENLKTASALVQEALAAGCALIALPELFNTGYFVGERDHELAETIPGPTTEWMRDLCAGSDSFLVGAIIERSPIEGVLYDTSVLVGREGVVGIY